MMKMMGVAGEWRCQLSVRLGIKAHVMPILCVLTAVHAANAQVAENTTHRDSITGRVTSDSGKPIPAALVSITMAPVRITHQVTTDSAGRYAVVVEAGSGDYLVHASAPLWNSGRSRATRQATESTFVVDLKLTPKIARVATVSVEATRLRPSRRSDESIGVGAAEQIAAAFVARDTVLRSRASTAFRPSESEGHARRLRFGRLRAAAYFHRQAIKRPRLRRAY